MRGGQVASALGCGPGARRGRHHRRGDSGRSSAHPLIALIEMIGHPEYNSLPTLSHPDDGYSPRGSRPALAVPLTVDPVGRRSEVGVPSAHRELLARWSGEVTVPAPSVADAWSTGTNDQSREDI
jgi:hypothetical protein